MTATHVNGVAVIADEPTLSPIKDRTGRPVYWQQVRTLLLEDDTEAYGCAHCDYTSSNPRSIRPHLKVHRVRKVNGSPAGDLTLTDLLARLADLEKVTHERDQWRGRALDAEKRLTTLRKALRP